MKTFRRIIASTIAVLMILASLLTVNVFAETVTFPDVADDYAYKNAIYSLVEAGIINGIKDEATGVLNFKPEDTITRAEFAKLIAVKLAGNAEFAEKTAQFPDVAQDHWANGYIAYAVKAGIINGNPDGTFRPENPVTYGEAIKMLVCAKGYGSLYTPSEPWYDGYIRIANQIELTKYAQSIGSNPAPRGRVAQLIYNMDFCKVINVSGGANGSGGLNLKNDQEDYEEMNGILEAVFEDTLTGQSMGLNKLQVIISGVVYNIGGLSLDRFYPYLGKMVYIRYEEGTTKTILSIEESGSNDTITIKANNIDNVDGRIIEYYESDTSNKTKEARLSTSDLYVIYNGIGVPQADITDSFIENYLDVEVGEITLMNNNGGNDYEIAYVTSYETYFVTGKGNSGDVYTITDSNNITGPSIVINADDCEDKVFKVSSVGGTKNKSTLGSIPNKSVISVAIPYNTTKGTEVIISDNKKSNAEVDELDSDSYIVIGGQEYTYSDYFLTLRDNKPSDYSLSVGDRATFYFDYAGNLVFFEKSESTDPYAYVLGYDAGQGLNAVHSISIYAVDKSQEVPYPVKDPVKVNGANKTPAELQQLLLENAAVINSKWAWDENDLDPDDPTDKPNLEKPIKDYENYGQLIRYKTSTSNGVTFLSEVYTIDKDNLASGSIVPGEFTADSTADKDVFTDGKNAKLAYKDKKFLDDNGGNQFAINDKTIIIQIPDDRTDGEKIKKRTGVFNNTDTPTYIVEPYDVKSNIAKIVLYYSNSSSLSYSNFAFVESFRTKKNDKGEQVQELTYYAAGETSPKTILTEKEDTLSGIAEGDFIRFAKEGSELVAARNVFVGGKLYKADGSEVNYFTEASGSKSDYYQFIYGTVDAIDVDANSISVVPGIFADDAIYDDSGWENFTTSSSTKIYKWNTEDGEFDEPGSDLGVIQPVQTVEVDEEGTIVNKISSQVSSQILAFVVDGKVKAVYILN